MKFSLSNSELKTTVRQSGLEATQKNEPEIMRTHQQLRYTLSSVRMLAIPRLKLRLRGAVEKLQEEKAFVDNWPPERNYLFFLAKYTLINYAATVNIHYSETAVQNQQLILSLTHQVYCCTLIAYVYVQAPLTSLVSQNIEVSMQGLQSISCKDFFKVQIRNEYYFVQQVVRNISSFLVENTCSAQKKQK